MEQQQLVQLSARALGQARAQADTTEAVFVDSYTSHLQPYLLLVQAEVVRDKNFLTTLLNGNLDNRKIYQNYTQTPDQNFEPKLGVKSNFCVPGGDNHRAV